MAGDSLGSGATTFHAGSGAGGAPGSLLVALDGALASATDIDEDSFIAQYGATPQPAGWQSSAHTFVTSGHVSSFYVGTGDGSSFAIPSLSGARGAARVQYIPAEILPEEDAPVTTGLIDREEFCAGRIKIPRMARYWIVSSGKLIARKMPM